MNVGVFYAVSTVLSQMILIFHPNEQESAGTLCGRTYFEVMKLCRNIVITEQKKEFVRFIGTVVIRRLQE